MFTRKLAVFASVMALLPVVILAADLETAPDPSRRIATFTLTDQSGTRHEVKFPRAGVLVLTVADRKASDALDPWFKELARFQEEHGASLTFVGVADVTGVPGALRGMIRSRFRERYTRPILLDWEGSVVKQLRAPKGLPSVFVVDGQGTLLIAVEGKPDELKTRRLRATVASALGNGKAVAGMSTIAP